MDIETLNKFIDELIDTDNMEHTEFDEIIHSSDDYMAFVSYICKIRDKLTKQS